MTIPGSRYFLPREAAASPSLSRLAVRRRTRTRLLARRQVGAGLRSMRSVVGRGLRGALLVRRGALALLAISGIPSAYKW